MDVNLDIGEVSKSNNTATSVTDEEQLQERQEGRYAHHGCYSDLPAASWNPQPHLLQNPMGMLEQPAASGSSSEFFNNPQQYFVNEGANSQWHIQENQQYDFDHEDNFLMNQQQTGVYNDDIITEYLRNIPAPLLPVGNQLVGSAETGTQFQELQQPERTEHPRSVIVHTSDVVRTAEHSPVNPTPVTLQPHPKKKRAVSSNPTRTQVHQDESFVELFSTVIKRARNNDDLRGNMVAAIQSSISNSSVFVNAGSDGQAPNELLIPEESSDELARPVNLFTEPSLDPEPVHQGGDLQNMQVFSAVLPPHAEAVTGVTQPVALHPKKQRKNTEPKPKPTARFFNAKRKPNEYRVPQMQPTSTKGGRVKKVPKKELDKAQMEGIISAVGAVRVKDPSKSCEEEQDTAANYLNKDVALPVDQKLIDFTIPVPIMTEADLSVSKTSFNKQSSSGSMTPVELDQPGEESDVAPISTTDESGCSNEIERETIRLKQQGEQLEDKEVMSGYPVNMDVTSGSNPDHEDDSRRTTRSRSGKAKCDAANLHEGFFGKDEELMESTDENRPSTSQAAMTSAQQTSSSEQSADKEVMSGYPVNMEVTSGSNPAPAEDLEDDTCRTTRSRSAKAKLDASIQPEGIVAKEEFMGSTDDNRPSTSKAAAASTQRNSIRMREVKSTKANQPRKIKKSSAPSRPPMMVRSQNSFFINDEDDITLETSEKEPGSSWSKPTYTAEETKALYGHKRFVLDVKDIEKDPSDLLIWQILEDKFCLRKYCPAKFGQDQFYINSPQHWYFAEEEFRDEAFYNRFQPVATNVALITKHFAAGWEMEESIIQYPYIDKPFFNRMVKNLGKLERTEPLRAALMDAMPLFIMQILQPDFVPKLFKAKEEGQTLPDPLKKQFEAWNTLEHVISQLLSASGASDKCDFNQETLNLLQTFPKMRYSAENAEKEVACSACSPKFDRVPLVKVVFNTEPTLGTSYDIHTLVEHSNPPKPKNEAENWCRNCYVAAKKYHRLAHFRYCLYRVMKQNVAKDVQWLQTCLGGDVTDQHVLKMSDADVSWRNTVFLDLQLSMAELEEEFVATPSSTVQS